MRASLTFLLLIFLVTSGKYAPFEDLHEKIHVEISDFNPDSGDEQWCFNEYLRIDVTVTGVDVQEQAINFYDFDNLCCAEDKPKHKPLD